MTLSPTHVALTLVFVAVLGWLSLIDWRTRRLPDEIVLPMLGIGLLLNATDHSFASPADAVLGAACGYAALWLIGAAYACCRGSIAFGGGDLKLAAMIGAWIGMPAVPAALLVAFASGCCAALAAILLRRLRLSHAVPFGPALAVGAVVALAAGPTLGGWLAPLPRPHVESAAFEFLASRTKPVSTASSRPRDNLN